jgi:TonB family protein
MLLQHASRGPRLWLAGRACGWLIAVLALLLGPTALFAPVFLAAPALAQQPELDALAARIGKRIPVSDRKRVVVGSFRRIGQKWNEAGFRPGRRLSERFAKALAGVRPDLEVIPLQRLSALKPPSGLQSIDIYEPYAGDLFAYQAGADLFVFGEYNLEKGALRLDLRVFDMASGKKLLQESGKLSLGDLPEPPQTEPIRDPLTGVYLSGVGGVSFPKCVLCPNPRYTDEARQKGASGNLSLRATITEQGNATDLVIVKPFCCGLDQASIQMIKTWKFAPAQGPDGKPVPARITIEMSFRIH